MAKPEDVVEEEILKFINNIADEIFAESQQNLVRDGKIDTGTLLKSGNINRLKDGAEIVYIAPYADDVEFGRLPGSMPPSDRLEKWVRRKLGVDRSKSKGVAFAVARAIKERGIQPAPYLRPAADKVLVQSRFGVSEVSI